jgi:hypothetical protein
VDDLCQPAILNLAGQQKGNQFCAAYRGAFSVVAGPKSASNSAWAAPALRIGVCTRLVNGRVVN